MELVKEFENSPLALWEILLGVRLEMLNRGYNPKEMPDTDCIILSKEKSIKPWQTLEKQIEILKSKNCKCKI